MLSKQENKDILKVGKELCEPSFIKSISNLRKSPIITGTFLIWLQLFIAWYIALKLNPIFIPVSLLIITACHQAMALWIHEGCHRLFENQKLNDLWVDFFFATPLGTTVSQYRSHHMTHHAYLGSAKDEDKWEFALNIRGKNLALVILKSLSGIYGFKTITKYLNKKAMQRTQSLRIFMSAFWNLSLLWLCILNERWYLYFLLWLIPLFTITKCLVIVRATAEHQPHDYSKNNPDDTPHTGVVRTTLPNWLNKWIFYQVNFNYHVEHHLFPNVPFYSLPKLHKYLKEKRFYDIFPETIQYNPIKKLKELSVKTA